MATTREFIDYIAEQADLGDAFTHKRMFGEYGLYLHDKVIAFACDNSLFIKAAPATESLTAALPRRPPYPGAKLYPVADELLDDGDALRALLIATEAALPAPKPKKAKAKKLKPD
ncbi:MAG: TfoX/Sxy family protein [Lysobacter sp.]